MLDKEQNEKSGQFVCILRKNAQIESSACRNGFPDRRSTQTETVH